MFSRHNVKHIMFKRLGNNCVNFGLFTCNLPAVLPYKILTSYLPFFFWFSVVSMRYGSDRPPCYLFRSW